MIETFGNIKYGDFVLADGNIYKFASNARFLLSANKDIYDEDWKTAFIRGQSYIPKGTQVELEDFFCNFYGEYFAVRYKGYLFYAAPSNFNYVEMIKGE